MDDSIYVELPDDCEEAFIALEGRYRAQLDQKRAFNEEGSYEATYRREYMNAVVAAARSLGIPEIADYDIPSTDDGIWNTFVEFETAVTGLVIQLKITHGRRRKKYSVALDSTAKEKIRHYIGQIRTAVEQSDLSLDKREAIFKKLADLTLEIDRDRTRFEIIADTVRSLAGLSGDVARDGAEPWWKWVKGFLGVVDEAKNNEPQPSLPAPSERKRLEPPRKQLPSSKDKRTAGRFDDDIPF